MDDGELLLKAILDNPDDDAVWLVYADWLEEHGQSARAEFIRVQIDEALYVEEVGCDSLSKPERCPDSQEAFFDAFPPEMAELRDHVLRVAPQETTVLLTGETGTGKTAWPV